MSLPWISYENSIFDATLTAMTENAFHPVANLNTKALYPAYRSADRALNLNGTDEYMTSASADFAYTTKFALEWSGKLSSAATSDEHLVYRFGGGNGYIVTFENGNKIAVFLDTAAILETDTLPNDDQIIKVYYNGGVATPVLSIWVDDVEVVKAEGASITSGSGTLTGTIPATITNSGTTLYVAANDSGLETWGGTIGHVALTNQIGVSDNSRARLDPSMTDGYWTFDEDDLTDSSGNGNDLTGVGIDSTNYVDYTSFQWVWASYLAIQTFDYLVIDRRHNLTSNANIIVHSLNPYNNATVILATSAVVAGEAITIDLTAAIANIWIEFNDSDNPDGYLEIPYIHLTPSKIDLNRSWLNDGDYSDQNNVTIRVTDGGSRVGQVKTESPLWRHTGTYRPLNTSDQQDMLAAIKATDRGIIPIALGDDNDPQVIRIIYLISDNYNYVNQSTAFFEFKNLRFEEIGGGISNG